MISKSAKEDLEQMNEVMSPHKNYKCYRKIHSELEPPFVPFLGKLFLECGFVSMSVWVGVGVGVCASSMEGPYTVSCLQIFDSCLRRISH